MHRTPIYHLTWAILAALIFAAPAMPADFSITPRIRSMVPADGHVSAGSEIAIDAGYGMFGLRLTKWDTGYSYSEMLYNAEFIGIGPVLRFDLPIDGLRLSAALLYIFADASLTHPAAFKYCAYDSLPGESSKQIARFSANDHRKEIDLSNAWGGEATVEYYFSPWTYIDVGIEAGGRWAKHNRKIYSYEQGGAWWVLQQDDDFSSVFVGLFVGGRF